MKKWFVWGLAGALAGAAWGAENVLANAGFESGVMAPWTAKVLAVSPEGARSGNYGAYFFARLGGDGCPPGDGEQTVGGEVRQDFGREISPEEARGVDFWVYYAPDAEGNPWRLDVALGPNEMTLSSSRGELRSGWNHVWFPVGKIARPFAYIYIKPSLTTG